MNKAIEKLVLFGGFALLALLIMKIYKAMITDSSTGSEKAENYTEDQKKEQIIKMSAAAKKIDYSKLPKKSQTFYQGVADALFECFDQWNFFAWPGDKQRIAEQAMRLLGVDRSIKDSTSYYTLAELEAIYMNFAVRSVKSFAQTTLTGNLVYFFDYFGDNQIKVDAHNLFRLV